jgi:endonuclease YncB( thermonuclease family)
VNKLRVLICCAIICASSWAHGEDPPPDSNHELTAVVVAVLDGDTVLVRRNGSLMKIRLAEIDAPEKAQTFGPASRNTLMEMVFHKLVSLHTVAIDIYERSVALLKVNGLNVNEEMVRRGMAWEYSNYHSDRNFIALQQEARQAGRGLWSQNDPIPPWVWRKQHTMETNTSRVLSPDDFNCGAKHQCAQMRSCDEAFYYFAVCGVQALNPSGDGVPCEKLCANDTGK